jgi:ATP-dependent Lhr-like helicase
MLRATRRHPTADQWVSVSGADPLNLVGILTSGPRLPALAGNRLSYRGHSDSRADCRRHSVS